MLGVVKELPVPSAVPPLEAANQLMVPAEAAAPRLTVPAPQLEPGVVDVMLGTAFTVAETAVLEDEIQPAAETASA